MAKKPMLKKVQPKVWMGAAAVIVILLISWGLVRKSHSASEKKEIKGELFSNLDPTIIKDPDAVTAKKSQKLKTYFAGRKTPVSTVMF